MTELWAKSASMKSGISPPTILEHCLIVRDAAEAIWNEIEDELAEALLAEKSELRCHLMPLFLAAAILHDIGKANSAFQDMLRNDRREKLKQPVRHEILGAFLLTDPTFLGGWFKSLGPKEDIWPLVWAVAAHHLKMGDPARGRSLYSFADAHPFVDVALSNSQVIVLLREAAAILKPSASLPVVDDFRFETIDESESGLEQRVDHFVETSAREWNRLRRDRTVCLRTALLKALLISADVAGSALTADEKSSSEWVPNALSVRISPAALAPVIAQGTRGGDPLPFQTEVGFSDKPVTIVIAGCGNGKTTAAYIWAQRHAAGRKLWFTYPTTGTASAGYEGYLFDHPDLRTDLIHSRAEVDLQAMRGTSEDDTNEESLRLESLRAWSQQAIACTVDTVLGLLQNQRRPLFSFPAIVSGAFVFDEIHSYDGRLFGSLLRFLQTFPGVPVLIMSASIPPGRMTALRQVLGDRVGDVIRGDPTMEGYQRYRLEPRASAANCQKDVADALRDGKKVLWVCNTVRDVITTARAARDWAGSRPEKIIVFHSRFRYRNRVDRQKEMITRFREGAAVLAVTTQVCEMSLDISADLMVTAECPLPALVQRLGRLNRYATSNNPQPCLVYPFQGDPYNERPELIQTRGDHRVGMAATREAVRDLTRQPCSQQNLAERLDQMIDAELFETYSAWLDDGWLTEPAQLRDGGASITLIREEDLAEIERELGPEHRRPSRWTSKSLVPWTIPMLYHRGFRPVRRVGGYSVSAAGTVAYFEEEGASWQTSTS